MSKIYKVHLNYKIPTQLTKTLKRKKKYPWGRLNSRLSKYLWPTHHNFSIVLEEINLVEPVDAKANYHCCIHPTFIFSTEPSSISWIRRHHISCSRIKGEWVGLPGVIIHWKSSVEMKIYFSSCHNVYIICNVLWKFQFLFLILIIKKGPTM